MIKKIKKRIIKLILFINLICKYFYQYINFQIIKDYRFILKFKNIQPCLFDATRETEFDRHYIYHTAWAARRLAVISPKIHHDFSSSLYFIGIISTFFKVYFYDYRKANLQLTNVEAFSADLVDLNIPDNSFDSVSCMHVLEHIGLGRYGDALDPIGDLKAINELKRITNIDGHILIVVPVGANAVINFNANRIYTNSQIIEYFSNFELIDSLLITDSKNQNHLVLNPSQADFNNQLHGCGCYHFRKKF